MSLPLKAGVAALTIGSIGGISSGIVTYFGTNKEEIKKGPWISELIEEEYEYILLNKDVENLDAKWEAVWEKYTKDNTGKKKGEDTLKLSGWPTTGNNKLIEQLKLRCNALSKITGATIKDDIYKHLTNYCARGVTFEEKVNKEGLKILNKNGDQEIWADILRRSSALHSDLAELGSGGLGVAIDGTKIRQLCEDNKTNNKKEGRNGIVYLSYKKVCTKGKNEK